VTGPAAPTEVAPLTGDDTAWDAFVRTAPGATFFHLSRWKTVIEESFGFPTHYLIARRDHCITGVLPLVELRSLFGRRSLLSLPFAVQGGVCAVDRESRRELEAAARRLSARLGGATIELRDGLEDPDCYMRQGLYYRFRRTLLPSDAENMAAIPRKQRRMIRVGQQSGLTARVDADDFDAFYDLYARSVRTLGTPVFSAQYFRRLMRAFADDCVLLTVHHGTTPVAAVLSFFFNGTVLPYYAGSRREYFRHAVNDFMYWELMRLAVARGARIFDFGRSKKGTGAFDFKCHWGFEPEPLRYRVYAAAPEAVADHSVNDHSIRWLRRAWQRMPLGVTKRIGPVLIRHFGAYYT
jgi:FemAB-related protein (PEP-CTERM system-associated)